MATKDKAPAASGGRKRLTPKQAQFVQEYLVDLNATQAAIRAGYSERSARQHADVMLSRPHIAAAVAAAQASRSQRTEITQDMVLERWWQIATANPNELMQYRRTNCRHCHGKHHEYQWINEDEYQQACDAELRHAQKDGREPQLPSDIGGYGFNATVTPHAGCTVCFGEGHGRVHFNDTREVTGAAMLLYAGAKVSKEGIEVKVHDQAKALEHVARHLGMFKERVELTGKDGAPIQQISMNAEEFAKIAKEMLNKV